MQKIMIVIPVHNGAGMIERTLRSLKKQTYPCVDVVVVDNQSDDDTVKISKSLGVKVIENEKNLGRIGNWNKALDVFVESDAELCKIMFVGDTIEPTCLSRQIERITKDVQMVTCMHRVVKKDGEVYEMNHYPELTNCAYIKTSSETALKRSLEKGNWFAGTMGCVLFSKQALGARKFTEGLDWAGDWKFWAGIACHTKVVYITKSLASFYMDSRKGYERMAGSAQAQEEENVVKNYIRDILLKK